MIILLTNEIKTRLVAKTRLYIAILRYTENCKLLIYGESFGSFETSHK